MFGKANLSPWGQRRAAYPNVIEEGGAIPSNGPQSAADWGLPDFEGASPAGPIDLDAIRQMVAAKAQPMDGEPMTSPGSPTAPAQSPPAGLFGQRANRQMPSLMAPPTGQDNGAPGGQLALADNLPAAARAATSLGAPQASAIAGFPISPVGNDRSLVDHARALAAATNGSALPAGLPRMPGYDYDAAQAAILPPEAKHSKTHNTIMNILDVLAPALMSMGGDQAGADSLISEQRQKKLRQDQRQFETARLLAEWKHSDWARQNGADLRAGEPFTLGHSRMVYDPQTGQSHSVATAPTDFQTYAQSMGYEPGTEDYNNAQQDYVLRANGPTATDNREEMDDHRSGNQIKVEGVRQGNRVGLEGIRQSNRVGLEGTRQEHRLQIHNTPSYRDTHGGGGRASIRTVNTPAEAAALPKGTQYKTPDGHVYVR